METNLEKRATKSKNAATFFLDFFSGGGERWDGILDT